MPIVDAEAGGEAAADAAEGAANASPKKARVSLSTAPALPSGLQATLHEMCDAHATPEDDIKRLKKDAADLKKQKTTVAKELRNATRRNNRIKEKAKQLSDADLISVMMMRKRKQDAAGSSGREAEQQEEKKTSDAAPEDPGL